MHDEFNSLVQVQGQTACAERTTRRRRGSCHIFFFSVCVFNCQMDKVEQRAHTNQNVYVVQKNLDAGALIKCWSCWGRVSDPSPAREKAERRPKTAGQIDAINGSSARFRLQANHLKIKAADERLPFNVSPPNQSPYRSLKISVCAALYWNVYAAVELGSMTECVP